jgi:hypothetical protein
VVDERVLAPHRLVAQRAERRGDRALDLRRRKAEGGRRKAGGGRREGRQAQAWGRGD